MTSVCCQRIATSALVSCQNQKHYTNGSPEARHHSSLFVSSYRKTLIEGIAAFILLELRTRTISYNLSNLIAILHSFSHFVWNALTPWQGFFTPTSQTLQQSLRARPGSAVEAARPIVYFGCQLCLLCLPSPS